MTAVSEFEFAVGGMTCAACAARIQNRLNKLPGVTASVNLASERAVVLAPATITPARLAAAIEAVGYTASIVTSPGEDAAEESTVRRLRWRLYLALAFFIPLTDAWRCGSRLLVWW